VRYRKYCQCRIPLSKFGAGSRENLIQSTVLPIAPSLLADR
jgi:hypothetical protein